MAADHFCLRWNNYQSNMVSELDILRTEEYLVDVSLCCEGHKFTAHKVILSACSPYFRNVFKENPCEHPVVILKDVSPEDVEALLSFIYQGVVYISEKKLSSFLQTAELLQIKGLAGAASSLQDETAYSTTTNKQPNSSNGGASPVKRRKSAPVRLVKSGEEGDDSLNMDAGDPSPNTDDSQPSLDQTNPPSNDPQIIKSELMSYDHSQDIKQDDDCSGLEEDDGSENGCSVDGLGGSGLEDKGSFYLGQVKTPQSFSQPDSQSQICSSLTQANSANSQLINSTGEMNNSNQFPSTPPGQSLADNVSASGERNGRRPCPLCTKIISNKSNLLKHMRIRHSDAYNPACCVLCNKIFKNKYSLRAHLNIYHKEYINTGVSGSGGGGQANQSGQHSTPPQNVTTSGTNQQQAISGQQQQQALTNQSQQVQQNAQQVQQNAQQVAAMSVQQQVSSTATLSHQLLLQQTPQPYQTIIHTPPQTGTFCIKAEATHTSQLDLLSSYIK